MPGIVATFSFSKAAHKLTPEKKNPPVLRADNAQGDGGVDVTGAPKSGSVEGADFGQLFCLSDWKKSLGTGSCLKFGLITVTLGGSNF
ncbi:hypothetical protein [Flavilitoribacter nigricans]|nr:hypothetical protein [Flavilitoribacter nigricans]